MKDGGVLFEQSPQGTLGAVTGRALKMPPRRVFDIVFSGDDLLD